MTSFYFFKDPISTYGYFWGTDFNIWILEGHNSACNSHQKLRKRENCHNQKKAKDTWQLNIYPKWNPGTEKNIRLKLRIYEQTTDFS